MPATKSVGKHRAQDETSQIVSCWCNILGKLVVEIAVGMSLIFAKDIYQIQIVRILKELSLKIHLTNFRLVAQFQNLRKVWLFCSSWTVLLEAALAMCRDCLTVWLYCEVWWPLMCRHLSMLPYSGMLLSIVCVKGLMTLIDILTKEKNMPIH